MAKRFVLSEKTLRLSEVAEFTFRRQAFSTVEVDGSTRERVAKGHRSMMAVMEKGIAVYGVTTGFGDSSNRLIPPDQSEALQANLVSYLLCGTGPVLPKEASRATLLIRLKSMCRGYSGVSPELVDRMRLFAERDWIPVVPREGSLGASGDLIPLAYLARVLQGEGRIHVGDEIRETSQVLKENGIAPYTLKAKEGLALVNGTSSMAGLALVNQNDARYLTELACIATSWLVLALGGRTEAFGPLVNEKAKTHSGQALAARKVRELLAEENYQTPPLPQASSRQGFAQGAVQDRYSLRCAPQVLGPIFETLNLIDGWLETEINGVADNPLVDDDGSLATGGNFYGGYLSHGMDYLKISLANLADLLDRQLMLVIDEKSNRGLPPNLAAWNVIPEGERFLHHGLKGLHQAVNAITSEILARATPNSIFSRSSESHNQDKVSLGMSAAVQCSEMIEPLFTITAMSMICLAQALDLKGIQLRGADSQRSYKMIRSFVPFVTKDTSLGDQIQALKGALRTDARELTPLAKTV